MSRVVWRGIVVTALVGCLSGQAWAQLSTGAIAGTVGAMGAIVLSWAVARFGLDLPWEPAPLLTIGGIVVTASAVAAIGVIASLDVLRHKPLSTLRAE